jgi:hypothetical protein
VSSPFEHRFGTGPSFTVGVEEELPTTLVPEPGRRLWSAPEPEAA